MSSDRLFHITSEEELRTARIEGVYRPAAFAREGFIHCSYRRQVAPVANRLFRGRQGLVLLEIDPARVSSPIVDENLEGGTELFPHIYGPLPLAAVARVHAFVGGSDGLFELSPEVS
jgi:uncharacterized protein (DUF952 family)